VKLCVIPLALPDAHGRPLFDKDGNPLYPGKAVYDVEGQPLKQNNGLSLFDRDIYDAEHKPLFDPYTGEPMDTDEERPLHDEAGKRLLGNDGHELVDTDLYDEDGNQIFQRRALVDEHGRPLFDDQGNPLYPGKAVFDKDHHPMMNNDGVPLLDRDLHDEEWNLMVDKYTGAFE
jgi:hypothetical protein